MATCRNCRYYEILSITACSLGKCGREHTLVKECAAEPCSLVLWALPEMGCRPPLICGQCVHWDLVPPGSIIELCTYKSPDRYVVTGSRFICTKFGSQAQLLLTEEEAERRWQEYLAGLYGQWKQEDKKKKRKKKKRRWGIYHETYGWLGTGSGADFVTSKKSTARRLARMLVSCGWRIKRYPAGGVKE